MNNIRFLCTHTNRSDRPRLYFPITSSSPSLLLRNSFINIDFCADIYLYTLPACFTWIFICARVYVRAKPTTDERRRQVVWNVFFIYYWRTARTARFNLYLLNCNGISSHRIKSEWHIFIMPTVWGAHV